MTIEYKEEFEVKKEAIDDLGHVNNVMYLQWVQDISQKHWEYLVSRELRQDIFWVVLSHFIEYKRPAFEGDILELKTWVKKMEGVKSFRCVEIRRKGEEKPLVKSETVWCLMDTQTKHPKRISPELVELFEQ